MSADLLRRAAALMRERAQETTSIHGEWYAPERLMIADRSPVQPMFPADAEHIASWHPAVALAVAEWLDRLADQAGDGADFLLLDGKYASAVARAYLGETS